MVAFIINSVLQMRKGRTDKAVTSTEPTIWAVKPDFGESTSEPSTWIDSLDRLSSFYISLSLSDLCPTDPSANVN